VFLLVLFCLLAVDCCDLFTLPDWLCAADDWLYAVLAPAVLNDALPAAPCSAVFFEASAELAASFADVPEVDCCEFVCFEALLLVL
jgi:hypothetical protein